MPPRQKTALIAGSLLSAASVTSTAVMGVALYTNGDRINEDNASTVLAALTGATVGMAAAALGTAALVKEVQRQEQKRR